MAAAMTEGQDSHPARVILGCLMDRNRSLRFGIGVLVGMTGMGGASLMTHC